MPSQNSRNHGFLHRRDILRSGELRLAAGLSDQHDGLGFCIRFK